MSRQEDFIDAGIAYRMKHSKPMCIAGSDLADVERDFKDNPNGYEEVMKAVNEQVPEDIREGILERFNRLYEQSKKQQ